MKEIGKTPHTTQPGAPAQALPSASPYLIPDQLQADLDLVLCGTALGRKSLEKRAYYAHPLNKFWKILEETELTPRRFAPEEYPLLLSLKIGLTDLCKTASGNDDELPKHAIRPDELRAKMLHYQPRLLAFTSKNGGKWFLKRSKIEYGLQPETIGRTQIYVLPSTSPLARGAWAGNQHHWHELAALMRDAISPRRQSSGGPRPE